MAKRINCNVPGCVMHSIMWKGINTLLKALERYAILTTGRQDQRKRGQPVSPWIKEKGGKYLRGWDRRATIILLGASVLLILYRFIGRRGVFTQFFGKFFIQHPLRRILPYFYWFWMSAVTLLLLPVLVIKFGIKDSLRDYGFRLTHAKLGWGFVLGAWLLMLPLIALALQFSPLSSRNIRSATLLGPTGRCLLRTKSLMEFTCSVGSSSSAVSCSSDWRNVLAIIAFSSKPSRSLSSTPANPLQKRWDQSLRVSCLVASLWRHDLLSTVRRFTGLSPC